jgi:hypothetical protein
MFCKWRLCWCSSCSSLIPRNFDKKCWNNSKIQITSSSSLRRTLTHLDLFLDLIGNCDIERNRVSRTMSSSSLSR